MDLRRHSHAVDYRFGRDDTRLGGLTRRSQAAGDAGKARLGSCFHRWSDEIVDDDDPNSELRHIFGEMPAMLAREPVAVGDKWTREMQIPLSGDPGTMGQVRATFRLDSLSRNGDIAFISMHGTMARMNAPGAPPAGAGYATSGTLSGTIQIDRRLGWITDSRSSIIVRSTIAAAPARKGEPQGAPMQVRTKITQWIRAMRTR